MDQTNKIVGIILSGGKSSRMGTEKGLVKYNNKALIEYSVDCLRRICETVVISSNKNCYDYLNLPVIKDEIANCGPIGGIYSCMKNINADLYFIISCDVPNVPHELYNDLLNKMNDTDLIYALDEKGRKQPLVAIYKSTCFPIIKKELQSGNYKMMKLLSLISHTEFLVSNNLKYYSSNILSNANSPDDLVNL